MSHSLSSDSYQLPEELKKSLRRVLAEENEKCGTEKYVYDGKHTVTVAADANAENLSASCKSYVFIFLAILFVAGLITFFITSNSPASSKSPKSSGSPNEDADSEHAFTASRQHLLDAHQVLSNIDPAAGWTGSSTTRYSIQNCELSDLIKQIADTNQGVDKTVRTEAEQVDNGREILGNSLSGLQLAIPVSEVLYFSGPTGPALSYSFQLAVANSAVGTGVDTTNTMHQNSVQNAEHLMALTQRYDTALESVIATGSTADRADEICGAQHS